MGKHKEHKINKEYVQKMYDLHHGVGAYTILDVGEPDKYYRRKVVAFCHKHGNLVNTNLDYKSKPSDCSGCFSESNSKYTVDSIQQKSITLFGDIYNIKGFENNIITLDCTLHQETNITQTLNGHFHGYTPDCKKCRQEKKEKKQEEKRKINIENTFNDLTKKFIAGEFFYKPLKVFFNEENKKMVKVECLKHKDENGKNHVFPISANSKSDKSYNCPGCLSEIRSEIRSLCIEDLKMIIKSSNDKIISENYYIIDFLKDKKGKILQDDFGNNLVKLGCNILDHTEPFIQSATNIGIQRGCNHCNKKRKYRKTAEDYISEIRQLIFSANLEDEFEYNNRIGRDRRGKIKFNLICKNCNTPSWHYKQHIKESTATCPKCKPGESKGAKKVEKYLLFHKLQFTKEKTFPNLKNIQSLAYDFYLPKYNLCIEFDGLQHFEAVNHFKGLKKILETISNDLKKNNYCKKKKINLLRIAYYDYKNIEICISNAIKEIDRKKENNFLYKIFYTPIIVWRRRKHKEKKGRIVFFDYNRFKLQTINIISLSNDNRKTSFRKIQYSAGKFY